MQYVSINENNCNVVDITEKVRSDFENHNLVLVQVNSLWIEENGVTWGIYLKFSLYTIHVFHKEPQFYLRLTVFYFQINIYRVSLDHFLPSVICLESISGKRFHSVSIETSKYNISSDSWNFDRKFQRRVPYKVVPYIKTWIYF